MESSVDRCILFNIKIFMKNYKEKEHVVLEFLILYGMRDCDHVKYFPEKQSLAVCVCISWLSKWLRTLNRA